MLAAVLIVLGLAVCVIGFMISVVFRSQGSPEDVKQNIKSATWTNQDWQM